MDNERRRLTLQDVERRFAAQPPLFPAWDQRISASVSNCGYILYRQSFRRDAGFQAEFVVPGFAARYDLEDVIEVADQCRYLLIAADADKWSRGAADIVGRLSAISTGRVRVEHVAGGHQFSPPQRRLAYEFLSESS